MVGHVALTALLLLALTAPPAAALVPDDELFVPLPRGERCGYSAGPLKLNCARVNAEGSGGPCTEMEGGWECPYKFAVIVDSYWWKNAGSFVATLDGSCSGAAGVGWDLPPLERNDQVRCEGVFFLPAGGCAEVEVRMAVTFHGEDAPAGDESGMGMGVCVPG